MVSPHFSESVSVQMRPYAPKIAEASLCKISVSHNGGDIPFPHFHGVFSAKFQGFFRYGAGFAEYFPNFSTRFSTQCGKLVTTG